MKNYFAQIALAITIIFCLCACGGAANTTDLSSLSQPAPGSSSSKSSSNSSAQTNKTAKASLYIDLHGLNPHPTNLTEANFAVVTVDLSGKILKKQSIGKVKIPFDNAEAYYDINLELPEPLTVDKLLVVDISKTLNIALGSNIKSQGLLYTPITSHQLSLSIFTTSAYNNYLKQLGKTGSFAAANIDVANTTLVTQLRFIIENIHGYLREISIPDSSPVETELAGIDAAISELLASNIVNLKHDVKGSTVGLVRDEGGMFAYSGDYDAYDHGDITYEAFIGKNPSQTFDYNFSKNIFEPTTLDQNSISLSLGKSGWVDSEEARQVYNYNSDGTLTISPKGASGFDLIFSAVETIDVSGMNINEVLKYNHQTYGLSLVTDPNKQFPQGSKIYVIGISMPQAGYILNINHAVSWWQKNSTKLTNLADVFSPDVQSDQVGFKALNIENGAAVVQLIDNSLKTANFYDTYPSFSLGAKGTWKNIDLPFLSNSVAKSAIQFNVDSIVQADSSFESIKNTSLFIAPFEGTISWGIKLDAFIEPILTTAFNKAAHNAIQGSLVGDATSSATAKIKSKPQNRFTKIKPFF